MKIFIFDRETASLMSYMMAVPFAVVSITDNADEPNEFAETNPNLKGVIRVPFEDKHGNWGMTAKQARQVADFVDLYADKVGAFFVHCEHGSSRSAGTAAAIALYLNNDDNWIWSSSKYSPNETCYELMLDAFGIFLSKADKEAKYEANRKTWSYYSKKYWTPKKGTEEKTETSSVNTDDDVGEQTLYARAKDVLTEADI